jgi:phosphate transport system permease protein
MKKSLTERIKRRDRMAGKGIQFVGLLVIASVIGILALITNVALPLFYPPSAKIVKTFTLPPEAESQQIIAAGLDDYLESGFLLNDRGVLTFVDLRSGKVLDQVAAERVNGEGRKVAYLDRAGRYGYGLAWDDGVFTSLQIKFSPGFDEQGVRTIKHEVVSTQFAAPEAVGTSSVKTMVRQSETGVTRVDISRDDRITVTRQEVTKDLFGTESIKNISSTLNDPVPGRISTAVLDHKGEKLYVGTDRGNLLRWDLAADEMPKLMDSFSAFTDGRAVATLGFVVGDTSLAVADDRGGVTTWSPVSSEGLNKKQLRLIHRLSTHSQKVVEIIPSLRDKSLLSIDADGIMHLDHMTSERHLLTIKSIHPIARAGLSAKGNGLIGVDKAGTVSVWQLDIPHPEVSFTTLFGKVWYEGYNEPAYVWQSSAANDDFEPKLSLTPLIFGTLKGTFYAMIFAIPLALLGAIYTSQFLNQRIKAFIKPSVEIMAAIPSVVVGFLGGLWLAPILDKTILGFFLSMVVIPISVLIVTLCWQRLKPASRLERAAFGHEFIIIVPAILVGGTIAFYLGGIAEVALFGNDFKLWLYDSMGIRADQRNSMVISLALGFAVIPIIFTIAEDALSNVPKSLSAASLALGASRWQTAWRVVLPSAVPGIFSAIMIGFGRAVGETMIVLMATGNTPIINLSMFDGFRSLSANIAVEIPEAPYAGTLYRVLFLSAVLLFAFTFIVNTVAEIYRQRFRKKYGRY